MRPINRPTTPQAIKLPTGRKGNPRTGSVKPTNRPGTARSAQQQKDPQYVCKDPQGGGNYPHRGDSEGHTEVEEDPHGGGRENHYRGEERKNL